MRMNLAQWHRTIMRPFTGTPRPKRQARQRAQPGVFTFFVPSAGRVDQVRVKAMTRSEARAELKRMLGVDRLPAGISRGTARRAAG